MQNSTYYNYAKLMVPGHKKDIRALQWRIALIDREGLYPKQELIKLLASHQTKNLNSKDRDTFIALTLSDEVKLDELEITTLIVIKWLENEESIDEERLKFLHHQSRLLLGEFSNGGDHEIYVKQTRSWLCQYGRKLLKGNGLKIRAKIALQEIAAIIAPGKMIPYLVSLSPTYLGCQYIQNWIRIQQSASLKNNDSSEGGLENLKNLAKAITGDRRTTKKRRYSYWRLAMHYSSIVNYIELFREQREDKSIDRCYVPRPTAVNS